MPTYVVLLNWTDQGVRNFRDTLDRADAAASGFRKLGGEMKSVYWTMGAYDVVAIVEAPDDETATAMALGTSAQGNVRTTTLRAFSRKEVQGILEKLSSGKA